MSNTSFDADLVHRHDRQGPRYTSYPTALQFHTQFDHSSYRRAALLSNAVPAKPLSAYIHIPFCASPCFYCGCNKVITRDERQGTEYLRRLAREIELQARLFDRSRPVRQLHFGGGTPTFLTSAQLGEVHAQLRRHFTIGTLFARQLQSRVMEPPMVDAGITLSAAPIAGIVGSGHCFAMCGGLAGALGMRARISGAGHSTTLRNVAAYQLGRIGGYTLGGTLAGFFGTTLQSAVNLPQLAIAVRIASGVLLGLIAIRILSGWNALAALERFGARLWGILQPVARHAAERGEISGSLLPGFVWGWLPCGLVYSMLLFAALSGSAWTGAALMLAFGIGTSPAMLSSGILASQFQTLFRKRWPRAASGVLLLIFGVWLATAAVNALDVEQHHQHHDHLALIH